MDTQISSSRALRRLVGMAALGTVTLLLGVAWDARLHAADPALATSEGVLSVTNPAHVVSVVGVVLVAIGVAGASWIVWLRSGPSGARVVGVLLLAIGTLVPGGVIVSSGTEAAHGHTDELVGVPEQGRGDHQQGLGDHQQGRGHHQVRDYDALWDAASAEERAAATRLVDDTREAARRYADFEEGLSAGYRPNPRSSEKATHHPNHPLMRDGKVLDPTAPESLIYWTAPDGGKVLVGVVYKAASSEQAPAPGGALTAWHTHAGGDKCHPALDAGCPQDTTKMLHVFFFDGVHDPFTDSMVAAAGGREAFARAMRE